MTVAEQYKKFEELDKLASQGGGIERVEKQHANGHMTARERIDMLLDKGTFNELDKFVIHHCSDFGMDKKQRIQTFSSGSSHAMTLMAVDLDKAGKPKKWMVENSWGSASGYRGHLIMTDKWFDEYMFRVVAEKKYVPAKVLDILKQKPIRLPAWDPMFADEE